MSETLSKLVSTFFVISVGITLLNEFTKLNYDSHQMSEEERFAEAIEPIQP